MSLFKDKNLIYGNVCVSKAFSAEASQDFCLLDSHQIIQLMTFKTIQKTRFWFIFKPQKTRSPSGHLRGMERVEQGGFWVKNIAPDFTLGIIPDVIVCLLAQKVGS